MDETDQSMNADDLIRLMQEHVAEHSGGEAIGEVVGIQAPIREVVPPSQTALRTDRWTRRQGAELAESEWNKQVKSDQHEIADAYAASFELDVELAGTYDKPETAVRAKWYESLIKSDDFKAARAMTVGDMTMAEIGAESVCQSWMEYKATVTQDDLDGKESVARTIDLAGSAAKAAAKASQQVNEASSMGLGIGLDGQADNQIDPAAAAKLFKMMRNDPRLKKIMEIAGKMRQVLYAKQGAKLHRGAEEVVDICLSGDLRRIFPSEIAKLDSPLHDMMLQKILSKQALSRKMASIRPVAKGPVVVYLDESGSMTASASRDPLDSRLANGKAMCLTMARLAMMQKRWCMLVGYSDDHVGNVCVLKPGEWDTNALMAWVQHFYSGGTTLDCPLESGPFGYTQDDGTVVPSYWDLYDVPRGKTDVILISDGLVDISDQMKFRFNDWKKRENVKCYSIIIDCDAGPMMDVSDRLWKVKSLGVMTEAVSELCGL